MKIINSVLSGLSACVAFGTGWAIYTGATGALGMWWVIALIVAGAVIALDVAAGLLITDIYRFNQGARNQTERAILMPVRGAWIALGLAIITEIVLSLLVVVLDTISVWGVLVFPPMTLAGIFVNSLRRDLDVREAEREQIRAQIKQEELGNAEQERLEKESRLAQEAQEKQERREERRKRREEQRQVPPPVVPVAVSKRGSIGSDQSLLDYLREHAGQSQQQIANAYGVSRSAVGQRIKKLKDTGLLAKEFESAARRE
jgi:DNA-binding transcriptional ArsR family regulator